MAVHDLIYTFLASFISLFPVMNPISSGFIVNGFLEGADSGHRKVYIKKIVRNTLFVGLGSLAVGHLVLLIFGLAVPVIQVGGGIIICKTGLDWLSDSGNKNMANKEKTINAINLYEIENRLFYPITFPVAIGPGTISIIFTLIATGSVKGDLLATGLNYTIVGLVIMLLCFILYLFLSQGTRITQKLGASGSLIINKLVAFLTFCIGIQILVNGIGKIFHINIL